MATAQGKLSEATVSFAKQASCCVVLASKGYPGKLENQGAVILVPEEKPGVIAYHAGTKLEKDGLTARGGRVLGITAVVPNRQLAKRMPPFLIICFTKPITAPQDSACLLDRKQRREE